MLGPQGMAILLSFYEVSGVKQGIVFVGSDLPLIFSLIHKQKMVNKLEQAVNQALLQSIKTSHAEIQNNLSNVLLIISAILFSMAFNQK